MTNISIHRVKSIVEKTELLRSDKKKSVYTTTLLIKNMDQGNEIETELILFSDHPLKIEHTD